MDTWKKFREDVRRNFYPGRKVKAVIYALRDQDIWEPQDAIVDSCVTEEDVKNGYRFGIMVKYDGKVYWVEPSDCKRLFDR